MELSLKTKIGDLLDEYPFIMDYLTGLSPKFSKLKNPILRKTLAPFASLSRAADMGGLDPDEFLTGIALEILRRTNDNLTLINPGGRGDAPMGRKERIQVFKNIVMRLHHGEPLDSVRDEFHGLLSEVSPAEVGAMEQELVADGIPETEIRKLCDLHVELFTSQAEAPQMPEMPEGHPIHTFKVENALAEEKAAALSSAVDAIVDPLGYSAAQKGLKDAVADLSQIIRHYERKENQLFPIMEAQGLTAPPQVMWEIHDDIRAMFKTSLMKLGENDHTQAVAAVHELTIAVRDMIFKEERILFPMVHESFEESDWKKVRRGEAEIGFAWVDPGDAWLPKGEEQAGGHPVGIGEINLDAGILTPSVLNALLKHLPVDLTFVGPDDRVAYFSQTEERIFPRSAGIIGREVSKCHPPKSVHVVEEILSQFREGRRDNAEFWIELGGRFIHIRYFAVRDRGKYLGCLEVSQDVTDIRALEGEQRLLDWE
ncbi:MAG: DUF438 domain-containing protein [Desulfobacterales bacterium]|nr:DUF438 domain-containing protein [Desulfobacterales bacterium]